MPHKVSLRLKQISRKRRFPILMQSQILNGAMANQKAPDARLAKAEE